MAARRQFTVNKPEADPAKGGSDDKDKCER
jgi:hypothetical protein